MSKAKPIIETPYFDPNADLKDAEVKIKSSVLNKLRADLAICIEALKEISNPLEWKPYHHIDVQIAEQALTKVKRERG